MVGKVWGKRVEKKYAKIAWELGRDRVVKTSSWYTRWLVNCDSLRQHYYVNHWLQAHRVLQTWTCRAWVTLDVLTFVFQKVGWVDRLRYLKRRLQVPPLISSRHFSLVHYFTARSVFSLVCTEDEAREPRSRSFVWLLARDLSAKIRSGLQSKRFLAF